jgi:hypothetical protein
MAIKFNERTGLAKVVPEPQKRGPKRRPQAAELALQEQALKPEQVVEHGFGDLEKEIWPHDNKLPANFLEYLRKLSEAKLHPWDYTTMSTQLESILLSAQRERASQIETSHIPWTLRAILSFYAQNYDIDPDAFRYGDPLAAKQTIDQLIWFKNHLALIGDETYPLPDPRRTGQPLVGGGSFNSAHSGSGTKTGYHPEK